MTRTQNDNANNEYKRRRAKLDLLAEHCRRLAHYYNALEIGAFDKAVLMDALTNGAKEAQARYMARPRAQPTTEMQELYERIGDAWEWEMTGYAHTAKRVAGLVDPQMAKDLRYLSVVGGFHVLVTSQDEELLLKECEAAARGCPSGICEK